jgi:hypothetical protein
MTPEEIDALLDRVVAHAEGGERDRAWSEAAPLVRASQDPEIALALISLVRGEAFERPQRLELLKLLFAHHPGDDELIARLGLAFELVHPIHLLNGPPPDDPFAAELGNWLKRLAQQHDRVIYWDALAIVARLLGRAWDETAERALKRCCELEPQEWGHPYGLGLFYKTRGRFSEGLAANQRAAELGGADDESVRWNLAICATGARQGARALEVQRALGLKLKLGRFDLPDGGFEPVKLTLAQRPLAERDAAHDSPGREETIWIERLSACHGVVRSVLVDEGLGVDYGDVVLFDGAPITQHHVNGKHVPVFPHLATLERRRYWRFPFAGTQSSPKQLMELNPRLPEDAVLYSHTENVRIVCQDCALRSGPEQEHAPHEHQVVVGAIVAPRSVTPPQLLAAIDAAIEQTPGASVVTPALCREAGQPERAEREEVRHALLSAL